MRKRTRSLTLFLMSFVLTSKNLPGPHVSIYVVKVLVVVKKNFRVYPKQKNSAFFVQPKNQTVCQQRVNSSTTTSSLRFLRITNLAPPLPSIIKPHNLARVKQQTATINTKQLLSIVVVSQRRHQQQTRRQPA